VGVFCARHRMAKLAFLSLFFALLTIPLVEWHLMLTKRGY